MLYEITDLGTIPIDLDKEAKPYLRIAHGDDDAILHTMIRATVQHAERYTGNDFRANTWKLTIDKFADRICIRRSPVASISQIQYLVSDVLTTIATSVYYLKKGNSTFSEVLLSDGQTWPSDLDPIEHGIEITFLTEAVENLSEMKMGMLKALAWMYENRGDCTAKDAAKESGATDLYDQIRIARV